MQWNEINDPGGMENCFNASLSTNANVASVKIRFELQCGGENEGKWSQIAFDNVRLRKHHDPGPYYYIG